MANLVHLDAPEEKGISLLGRLLRRVDNWANFFTGVGQHWRDKGTSQAFGRNMPKPFQYYSDLFHGDPIARRVAEKPPLEMLRQGFRLDLQSDDGGSLTSDVMKYYRELGAHQALFLGLSFARALGGAGIYVQVTDGLDPIEPLDLNRIESVDALKVIPRNFLIPVDWMASREKYGHVQTYQATILSPSGVPGPMVEMVDQSRIIRFDGVIGTDEQRARNQGWGDSVYLMMEESLGRVGMSFAALSTMLADSSVGVIKIKGLIDQISDNPGGEQILRQRMRIMDVSRSIVRSIFLDAEDEDFDYKDRTFSGVPETVDRMMYLASAVTGIPVTILFGRSPAGMNATGESDMRIFYDLMKSEQLELLEPNHRRLLEIIMSAKQGPTGGKVPETWTIHYNPLYQLTEKEQAEVEKLYADRDAVYLEWGVLTPQEVTNSHFGGDSYNPNISLDKDLRDEVDGQDKSSITKAQALDGKQAAAIQQVLESAASGSIPRDTAKQSLMTVFSLPDDVAEKMLANIGKGFTPKPPPAPPMAAKPGLPGAKPALPGKKPPPEPMGGK